MSDADRFNEQFAETEDERNERLAAKRRGKAMTALTPTPDAKTETKSDKEMVEADIDARIARIAGEMHPLFQASLKDEMLDLIRRSPADDTPKGWRLVKIADLATILALLPPKPLVKNGLMYMCADAEPGDRLHQIRDAFDTMLSNAPPAPGSNG